MSEIPQPTACTCSGVSGYPDCSLCAGEGSIARVVAREIRPEGCPLCLDRDQRTYGTCFVKDGCRVDPQSIDTGPVESGAIFYNRSLGVGDV